RPLEPTRAASSDELMTIKIRYKAPDGDTCRLVSTVLRNQPGALGANIGFASAVAEFGMLLRDSSHSGGATFQSVVEKARRFRGDDREGYRGEFIQLAELAA